MRISYPDSSKCVAKVAKPEDIPSGRVKIRRSCDRYYLLVMVYLDIAMQSSEYCFAYSLNRIIPQYAV